MKTLVKKILVLAVMLGTCTAYSNESLGLLSISNIKKETDKITVIDESGTVLYSGNINYTGNLISLFDFSHLKDGDYTVEVIKPFVIEIKSVNVKNSVVTFNKEAEKKIFKPVLRQNRSKVLISKLALDSHDMEVDLYYENELIFTEKLTGESIINRIYKLDEDHRGEYSAIMRSNGRTYVEYFRI